MRATILRRVVLAAFLLFFLAANCSAETGYPSYYVKKQSWQETIRASLQQLRKFEAEQAQQQKQRLKELGVRLGPWYWIGPFGSPNIDPYRAVFEPELEVNLEKTYADGKLKWIRRDDWQDGVIHRLSGDGVSGEGKVVADYMYREITASQEATLPVYLGSNDGIQVWFNGEKVLARDVGRRAAPDQDVVKLNLKKGVNKLLIKVNNRAAGHAFYFSMYPGGGVRTKRIEKLWELLCRDFPKSSHRRQMGWERADGIWEKYWENSPKLLADSYAKVTRQIGDFAKLAREFADEVGTWADIEKVRKIYYRSRLFDERIHRLEEKLRLVKNQFRYLRARFAEQENEPEWRSYVEQLQTLQKQAEEVLTQAKKAKRKALVRMQRLEEKLLKLYSQHLPKLSVIPKKPGCSPFKLSQVRLLEGPFKDAMERDRKYLYMLDSDRLLHMFRVTAGLPSSAKPLGGWERRELRGHTMGHYLSACAMMYASTGDEKLKIKADKIVFELAKCQQALGNGYLGAFPEEGIKKVIYGTSNWWAPWYTYHKIMAGLLDMYNYCGNEQALQIAEGMARWAKTQLDNIDEQQTQRMLNVEFGGMNEVLCNLYAATKNPVYLDLARRFDHKAVFEPLANFRDELTGLHVNTQIPKIIGAAREFELTGQPYYYNIATFFWNQVTQARSYCTGGTSNHEHWRTEPYVLAGELGPATQETCCTYNMLKLTRHLFCWDPQPRYADYYERALFNGILPTQDPETGMMMYFVPLGSGYWKIFNTPFDSFWCCTGTGLENHAKYGDSIYFHDEKGLYINLFIASELDWSEKCVRIVQRTQFPRQQGTTIIVRCGKPLELAIRIRVPYWATKPVTVKINGQVQEVETKPSSYLVLTRLWKDGDRIDVDMPMSLHLDRMPDDPNLAAIMYGPLVLAGQLGTDGMDPRTIYSENQGVLRNVTVPEPPYFVVEPGGLESWIKPVPGKPLTFRTVNAGRPEDVTLVPFYQLFGQRYAIYWRFKPAHSSK